MQVLFCENCGEENNFEGKEQGEAIVIKESYFDKYGNTEEEEEERVESFTRNELLTTFCSNCNLPVKFYTQKEFKKAKSLFLRKQAGIITNWKQKLK